MSDDNKNRYVMPTESAAEMARLIEQGNMATRAMGGLFPEDIDVNTIQHVLDVACGPGEWTQEVAFQHRNMHITGIDISTTMIQYARATAQVQKLTNLTYEIVDATQPLHFADNTFDIINARAMVGFLHKDSWPSVLHEFVRITRPGGFIVLTEADDPGRTNGVAFETLTQFGMQALWRTEHSFHPLGNNFGITPMLAHFLREAGCQDIQQRSYVADYSAGAPAHQAMFENMRVGQKLVQPFLIKLGLATQEQLDELYNQSQTEMLSEDFRALLYILRAWGRVEK
ncbi:hypothetical protein KSF_039800 [Reticulibacter mediterranei]|uniref:Methyltransferase domain-containing protein n=1 Tax=Reticulibacter mediterranei TaxID=2778369 RepID=A0A8J3N4B5_9CHLR|nr:class I SAM-dependent methyltransferase [Reticulibacter mediterranei]GHO93932.1 hypothetical protein KSF_039800 [Reticulibacter mediterranei]